MEHSRKLLKEIELEYSISNKLLLLEFLDYWIDQLFKFTIYNQIKQIKDDVIKLATHSYNSYMQYSSWKHGHDFSYKVATAFHISDGLFNAYRNLSPSDRYNEAYIEYKARGFSPVFCHRIAKKISASKFNNRLLFVSIEDNVKLYEVKLKTILATNRPIWQAHIYAEAVCDSGENRAMEILRLIDNGCFKLSDDFAKNPLSFYQIILPKEFLNKNKHNHMLIFGIEIY